MPPTHHPRSSHCRRFDRHAQLRRHRRYGRRCRRRTGTIAHRVLDRHFKENNDEKLEQTAEDEPSKKQSKRRRQRHRSKSRHSQNSDNNARENNTPVDSRGNDDHIAPTAEHDEAASGEHSTDPMSEHGDAEYKPHQTPLGRKTVRTKMHTSSRKGTWNKRTSAEGLLPQRGV